MIVTEKPIDFTTSESFKSQKYDTYSEEGKAFLFNIASNQIFTNKQLAIIREYSTNASDAHVESGIPERPIKVSLPNDLSPVLKIRNFGRGMSEEVIWNVYSKICESSKRKTNDQVGMLGIGSKSAFCYGDSFTVHTYIDGVKKTYFGTKANSPVGDFMEIGSFETDEENGTEEIGRASCRERV